MSRRSLTFTHHGLLALVMLGAVLIGALCGRPPAARSRAELESDIPAGHFLAGSERSLPVLEEISATMKRIDERLARIERIALQAVASDGKE